VYVCVCVRERERERERERKEGDLLVICSMNDCKRLLHCTVR
jgi:hypothetical protein